jgi:hypothetical protein
MRRLLAGVRRVPAREVPALSWPSRLSSSTSGHCPLLTTPLALDLLEAPDGCSDSQLKECFRKRALVIHPDQGGDADAMIRLTESYKQLLEMPRSQRTRSDSPMIPPNDPLNDVINDAVERDVSFGADRSSPQRKQFRRPPAASAGGRPFWELSPEDIQQFQNRGEPRSDLGHGPSRCGPKNASAAAAAEFVMNHAAALDEALRKSTAPLDEAVLNGSRSLGGFVKIIALMAVLMFAGALLLFLEVKKNFLRRNTRL